MAPSRGLSHKLIGKDWIPSIYGANDASCTSAGRISCLTMRFCVVLACSTSPTSSINEDWVSLVTSPDFELMHWQTRSSKFDDQDEGWWPAFAGVEKEWRRASGRPPITWILQIGRDTGVTATDALELAGYKPFWRTIAMAVRFGWLLLVWWRWCFWRK